MNPFVSGASGTRMGRPLQKAFGEVIRHIGLQTSIIAGRSGSAGTGKSLLVDMIARACGDMGLTARCINRGDQVQALLGTKSDVLLIDQTRLDARLPVCKLFFRRRARRSPRRWCSCACRLVWARLAFSSGETAPTLSSRLGLCRTRAITSTNERPALAGRTCIPQKRWISSSMARTVCRDCCDRLRTRPIGLRRPRVRPQIGAPACVKSLRFLSVSSPAKPDSDDARRQATRNDEGADHGAKKTESPFGVGTKELDRPRSGPPIEPAPST